MNTKKIFKWASIILTIASLILCIVTLVNYYNYVGVINKLSGSELTLLEKFKLQESLDTYSLRTFKTLLWTCYIGIATAVITIVTFILHIKRNQIKIR